MKSVQKSSLGVSRNDPTTTVGSEARSPARQEGQGRQIERLAAWIRQFRIAGQRFLVGDVPTPPDDLRERIQVELRRLRSASLKGAAANFRLGGLEAQFNSQRELFGRRLRRQEQGAGAQPKKVAPKLNPVEGVIVGDQTDVASAKALYDGLHEASGKPKMDLERFRTYLDRQTAAIRQKTGCREIQFRVAVENGKMKLKAKPIRQSGSS